jgi:hypothetical protein
MITRSFGKQIEQSVDSKWVGVMLEHKSSGVETLDE